MDAFVDPALDVTFTVDFREVVEGVAMGIGIGSAGRDLDALASPSPRLKRVGDRVISFS